MKKHQAVKPSPTQLPKAAFTMEVNWHDVHFFDGAIKVMVKGYGVLSNRYQFASSRRSFEHIKPYFERYDMRPLRVGMRGLSIVSIENATEINEVIHLLTVEDEVSGYFEDGDYARVKRIGEILKAVSNAEIIRHYKLRSRSIYFTHLCNKQADNYKTIPVIESQRDAKFGKDYEDGFIFTFTRKMGLYLIWESSQLDRASYVFKTIPECYEMDAQRIFDFISSSQKRKRTKLWQQRHTPLKCQGRAVHSNELSWRLGLNRLMR